MADELSHKLSKSPSVLSLQAEQRAARILEGLQWRCYQGAFYRDLKEDKPREIDVTARQIWKRGSQSSDQVARLNLVIEAKSARDWHIVFAGDHVAADVGGTARVWAGHIDTGRYRWLRDALLLNGRLPPEAVSDLIARFEELAFPNDLAILAPMFPGAPRAIASATAFRETNIDREKEIESSVLWRAMSTLRSATASLTAGVISWHAEYFELSPQEKVFSQRQFTEAFESACRRSVRYVDIFHPVVLIDSHLWLSDVTQSPRRITSCRFYHLSPIGSVEWWCDVVHSDAFQQFAQKTTGFYESFFRQRRARRMRLEGS